MERVADPMINLHKVAACGRAHNILILENELVLGGLEKKLLDLVTRMDREHFRVSVCCLKKGGYLRGHFVELGTPFYDEILRHKYDLAALRKVMRVVEAEQIDLVYTVPHSNTLVFASLLKRFTRVRRVVVSVHATGGPDGGPLFTRLMQASFGAVDRFIAVAESHRRYLIERERVPSDRTVVIENGVDLDRYRPVHGAGDGGGERSGSVGTEERTALRAELGLAPDDRVVVTVATLKPLKCINRLLEAAPEVVARFPGTHFLIVGDGPERGRLEGMVSSLSLDGRVTFTGQREDVDRLLRASDLFVLPSRTEALPNVILEAMATGLPVVATDVGSVRELVEPGSNGLIVPPEDSAALSTALQDLLGDEGQAHALGQRGREIAERRFALDQMCERRERLFAELLCGREGRAR